jgi:ribosome modulation factor
MDGRSGSGLSSDGPRQSPPARSAASDLLGPRLVLAIQAEGYMAALAGEHPSTCPWKIAADNGDAAKRQMWIRGYAAGRTDLRTARSRS